MAIKSSTKVNIDVVVHRLIAKQFPQWADLPIKPVLSSGWDNRTFHLGKQLSVRLPSAECYSLQVEKEHLWLPKLAPFLPLPIPVPLALGEPGQGYPWHWSIYRWLDGETAALERITDLCEFAKDLARFLVAFHHIDATGGPEPGPHNFYRGGLLGTYDAETRAAIIAHANDIDAHAAMEVWNKALASTWHLPPVWVHGDIAASNLLVKEGGLAAVIDFGCMGIGDPACDLAIAWTLFKGESREAFRAAIELDSDTWARGRGWALWKALCAAFPGSNELDRRVIDEVLVDHKREKMPQLPGDTI